MAATGNSVVGVICSIAFLAATWPVVYFQVRFNRIFRNVEFAPKTQCSADVSKASLKAGNCFVIKTALLVKKLETEPCVPKRYIRE